jgi:IMP dehydrogenase
LAVFYSEPSRTFSEYLLIPNLTTKDCITEHVSLKTPITKYRTGENPSLSLNIPFASAIMHFFYLRFSAHRLRGGNGP